MRGAVAAAQQAAEELRGRAEEAAQHACAAQDALQQRLDQVEADAAALEAAKGMMILLIWSVLLIMTALTFSAEVRWST